MTALDVASVTLAPVWFTPESPLIIRGRVPGAVVASRVQVDRVKVSASWAPSSKYCVGGWVIDLWLGRATGDPARPYDTIHHDSRDADTVARLAELIAEHTPAGRPVITLEGDNA
ncbi:hypothetical protein M2390_002583 [Mycetocola sp. BIGb0189]|uniref:hypothetical protein n=1 Tax=Mycetocola sp. BIGb0189 TaxID=2940604 RepID=UPI002169FD37|nr:hypothetical protein [Mycetocola sp. BIGb0189]MCS4277377.1 hypothetical protein [Mycetocola sp. BIGb0189]